MQAGTELDGGKYRIVRPLGSGGMGAVYEAVNTRTRKRVAIKGLLPSLALSNPLAAERLIREAEASCRVRHPNVVDVYDVLRDGSEVFLVMEYLEGELLTATLQRGDLPMYRLVSLLLPAMRAVAAAHAQGVVHRDIKPDNIFLARQADVLEPVPKVLDFGISKLKARGTEQVSLTRAGAAIGTPRYMSYEQLLGMDDIDGRADVYAFGVVLYEALTGSPPHEARSAAEWLLQFATPPTSPRTHRSELPGSLDRLIMWCLESDRDKRVPDMEALIRELEPYASALSFRNLLTMPSQASTWLSSARPTPEQAAAVLLERIRSDHTPKPQRVTPVPPGGAASVREPSAPSLDQAFTSTHRNGKRTLWLALGVGLLALALAYWLRSDAQPVETTITSAKSSQTETPPRATTVEPGQPKTGALPTDRHAHPGASVAPASPPTAAEPRPPRAVAPAQQVAPKAHGPATGQPAPAPQRRAKTGTDWGIY